MCPIIVFQTGFRPFFLAAAMFAVVGMGLWGMALHALWQPPSSLSPSGWHAHEMVFGYALAVIAGFLLTAVRNWTHQATAGGPLLLVIVACWLLARIMYALDDSRLLAVAMFMDTCFLLLLVSVLTRPVVQRRQWHNLAVLANLYVIFLAHVLYVLGWLQWLPDAGRSAIHLGLYMVLSLILVLARRVLPMFTARGTGHAPLNRPWVDRLAQPLFLLFVMCELSGVAAWPAAALAAVLALLHTVRLYGWYTHDIWQHPLLWVLYLACMWIIMGFAMRGMAIMADIPASLSLHAFAVGGIGMMTLGMMARVTLGHTGRDIMHPPAQLALMFAIIFVAAWVRVIFPVLFAAYTAWWMTISQLLWIGSFTVFLFVYLPMLTQPRADGRPG